MLNPKTVFRWHLWLGLFSGIFMFLIGLTGAIAVFAEEIDWLVIPPLRAKAAPDGRRADADTIVANLKARYPGGR
ncbi:MAG: PepSY domain-containing protein, partial [Lacunisphaera sp.]|nr:PepSY domain-containing protein [Lacunisphaera sp.]